MVTGLNQSAFGLYSESTVGKGSESINTAASCPLYHLSLIFLREKFELRFLVRKFILHFTMSITTGIRDVFREGNLSKVLEILAQGFNMNIRYIGGETTYQEDLRNGRYTKVRHMETPSQQQ